MARSKKAESDRYIRQDFSMDPEQLKKLVEYCQREERSMSWVVRKVLEAYLK